MSCCECGMMTSWYIAEVDGEVFAFCSAHDPRVYADEKKRKKASNSSEI